MCIKSGKSTHIYSSKLTRSHTDIHTRVICFEHDQGLQCKLYRENNSGILQKPNAKVVVLIKRIRYNVGIIKLMHYIRGA